MSDCIAAANSGSCGGLGTGAALGGVTGLFIKRSGDFIFRVDLRRRGIGDSSSSGRADLGDDVCCTSTGGGTYIVLRSSSGPAFGAINVTSSGVGTGVKLGIGSTSGTLSGVEDPHVGLNVDGRVVRACRFLCLKDT